MANNFLATANRVAAHLGKAPKDFTKEDIIRVVQDFDKDLIYIRRRDRRLREFLDP